jgi:hypothetical protein
MLDNKQEQVFEWDGGCSVWKSQQENGGQGDSSSVVNTLPIQDIKKAFARFNGYDLNDEGIKKESKEEKIIRLRREIEEVKHDKISGSENLLTELNNALVKTNEAPVNNTKPKNTENTSNVESRLAKLEKLVGVEQEYSTPLLSQTRSIENKLSLLEPDNLCMLETKMQNVGQRMERLSKNSMNDKQIGRMEEMERLVVKLGGQVPIIPLLVDRLESLKQVHEKAADTLSRNTEHHAKLEKLSTQIKSLDSGIKNLRTVVASNAHAIQENIKNLDSRISKL